MKFQKVALAFGVFALGVASAASGHHVTVSSPLWMGSTELKPGDYQVQVENGKAIFKSRKNTVEVPATTETQNAKYPATALSTETNGGKERLRQIEFGGTNMKLVIGPSAGSNAGE